MDKQFIILPHLKVTGANALNSLYSVGFPAVTAFLGFGHALQRRVPDLTVSGVGIVVHQADFQAVHNNYLRAWSLKGRKFPLIKDKKAKTRGAFTTDSFQPRAYVHLEVSLLLECGDIPSPIRSEVMEAIKDALPHLRLAGGTITMFQPPKFQPPKFLPCSGAADLFWNDPDAACRKALRMVMPGFALASRNALMDSLAEEGKGDALDRLLYATSSEAIPEEKIKGNFTYHRERHIKGWLVPLAVGFHDLSGSMTVKGQRSCDAEHHFVEPLVSLCEFRMPHRFESIEDILWHYEYDSIHRNYLCVNNNHLEKE